MSTETPVKSREAKVFAVKTYKWKEIDPETIAESKLLKWFDSENRVFLDDPIHEVWFVGLKKPYWILKEDLGLFFKELPKKGDLVTLVYSERYRSYVIPRLEK